MLKRLYATSCLRKYISTYFETILSKPDFNESLTTNLSKLIHSETT